ncbi:MAG: 1-acyl-sn-glycerol-3-phosphate acyltransferase [Bacteroidales bacterium]|nr:1-acyl-sn-glycerol-3-phosphate acyltransferase [Bacteroidales bacterium]
MKFLIISIYVWLLFLLSSVVLLFPAFFVWLITFPFDRNHRILHQFTSWWAGLYILINPLWKVAIENPEKLDKKKTYIIISNHQSMLDTVVLFHIRSHFKWVSKIENFRLPIIGWVMRMNGYIQVIRGDKESAINMVNTCKKYLNYGVSVLIFPEGTRSINGNLGMFKEGAFRLAVDAQFPILPLLIDGTGENLPKKGLVFRNSNLMKICILDEIPVEYFQHMSPEDLTVDIYNKMKNELKVWRNSAGK